MSLQLLDTASAVAAARRRLSEITDIKRKIGIIRLWPGQAVAEHENVERFKDAAALLGIKIVELDKFGMILGTPGKQVTRDDVDFVIHLHFETAKTYDAVSVAAMWNPTQFYFDWGFDRFWANQMSHDIFAYTGSSEIKSLVHASRGSAVAEDMPLLNHTLAEPFYAPLPKNEYTAFYCGINWEKVSGKVGRHDALLRMLDSAGLVSIYGPESVQNVDVWSGYKGYKGSLPFDGRTVIRRIAEAGTCLVFSSDAHKASNIMSNRLFEAMAGGAVVIGDDHPFIRQAIGDNYIKVCADSPLQQRYETIRDALRDFAADPDKALALAEAAQKRLLDNFNLIDQLTFLYESVKRYDVRLAQVLSKVQQPIVDIVIQPTCVDANNIVHFATHLLTGFGVSAHLIFLVSEDEKQWFVHQFPDQTVISSGTNGKKLIFSPIECLELVDRVLKTDNVGFFLSFEKIFFEQYIATIQSAASFDVLKLAYCVRHYDNDAEIHYDYFRALIPGQETHRGAISSVVFNIRWLREWAMLKGVDWQTLVTMAASQGAVVKEGLSPAIVADLRSYEFLMRQVKWSEPTMNVGKFIDMFSVMEHCAEGRVHLVQSRLPIHLQPLYSAPPMRSLVEQVRALTPKGRRAIAVELYRSMKLPRWVNWMVDRIFKISTVVKIEVKAPV